MFLPRQGQWVKYNGKVGIWFANAFHQTDDKGETVAIDTQVKVGDRTLEPVRSLSDIPEPRRAHLPANYNPQSGKVEE